MCPRVLDDVLLVILIYLWKERESFLQPLKHLRIWYQIELFSDSSSSNSTQVYEIHNELYRAMELLYLNPGIAYCINCNDQPL